MRKRASHPKRSSRARPPEELGPLRALENGLRVLVRASPGAPVAAAQLWVDVGSADEADELAGVAHVLEHMLFKGTKERGVGDIAREIEDAGGEINAWTSFDQTVYHVLIPREDLPRGLEVLADCVSAARIDAGELGKELQVIEQELKEGEDSPATAVAHDLFSAAFRAHPYGRPVIGRLSTVRRLGRDQVLAFYRRYYRPARMTLVVVGDVDEAHAWALVRKTFVRQAGRHNPLFRPRLSRRASAAPLLRLPGERQPEPPQQRMRVATRALNTREAYLSLGFRIPALVSPDTAALDLLAAVLGQGDSSRLVKVVKDELHVVTDVTCYAFSARDPGLFVVSATTRPERIREAFSAIVREVLALSSSQVGPGELGRAQAIVDSDWIYQQETMEGLARRLAFYVTVAGDLEFGQAYRRQLLDVDPQKLEQVARGFLRLGNMSVAVVAPGADGRLASALRQDARRLGSAESRAAPALGGARAPARAELFRLANGARLIALADRTVPLVAARAVWLGGLRYERASDNGMNNLLAAVLTRGTRSLSATQISEEIESMAGSLEGFSGRNSFGIRLEVASRHFDRALQLFADCAREPAFELAEVDARRQEVLDELHALEDDAASVAVRLFSANAFPRHPYGLDPLGSASSIGQISPERLRRYHQRHFQPAQMVLAVAGDIEPRALRRRFEELFSAPSRVGPAPPTPVAEARRSEPVHAVCALDKDKHQAHVVVGYPGTTVRSKDRYALEILAALLSGQSGRLFLRLRDELGLAYRLTVFSQEGIEPGFFATYLATDPASIDLAQSCILEEMDRVRTELVSADDLRRTQRYLIGAHRAVLQRRAAIASYLSFDELYGLGHSAYLGYEDRIAAVSPQRLRAAARRYLDESQRVIAIVQPSSGRRGRQRRSST